jgi:hypothetical protein
MARQLFEQVLHWSTPIEKPGVFIGEPLRSMFEIEHGAE